jgi:hypothetical protein
MSPPINQQSEKLVAPADHHNTSGQFTPSVHGYHGAVDVSLPGFPTPLDKRVIASTQESAEFPFNQDMNSGDVLGIGARLPPSLYPLLVSHSTWHKGGTRLLSAEEHEAAQPRHTWLRRLDVQNSTS